MSMGNRATSTEVPASPPATREIANGVWRSAGGGKDWGEGGDDMTKSNIVIDVVSDVCVT